MRFITAFQSVTFVVVVVVVVVNIFVFNPLFVSYCSVDLFVFFHYGFGMVCVSKVTNMTCILQLALDQTRSYSLGIPHTGTKLQPAFSRH